MNVLIFGSCVSRDIFNNTNNTDTTIDAYYARSSFASLSSLPDVDYKIINNIESEFQRRMVLWDMNKNFLTRAPNSPANVIVIDLIDERFNILKKASGSICTLSNEYLKAQKGSLSGRVINRNSEEKYALWKRGFASVMEKIRNSDTQKKVIINNVYWSRKTTKGEMINNEQSKMIEVANESLQRMYNWIRMNFDYVSFIDYDPDIFRADPNHRWGLSAFHYQDEVYLQAISSISNHIKNH